MASEPYMALLLNAYGSTRNCDATPHPPFDRTGREGKDKLPVTWSSISNPAPTPQQTNINIVDYYCATDGT